MLYLPWLLIGFYGCAIALLFSVIIMFFTNSKENEADTKETEMTARIIGFNAFVGLCIFGYIATAAVSLGSG